MNEPGRAGRRRFLEVASGAAMLPAVVGLLPAGPVKAAETSQLDEADPAAAALGYRKDTALVDATRYPQHQRTQVCSNCRYFQAKGKSSWGPCTVFAGKGMVNSRGWCAAYAAR